MEAPTPTPRLYIVMRRDLWDMNPGKGMAQAAHAQADFDAYTSSKYPKDEALRAAYINWCEDRTFGTTIVLSALYEDFVVIENSTAHSGITQDPTYPYKNWYGEFFTRREVTCMWVFAYTEADIEYMKKFPLHG